MKRSLCCQIPIGRIAQALVMLGMARTGLGEIEEGRRCFKRAQAYILRPDLFVRIVMDQRRRGRGPAQQRTRHSYTAGRGEGSSAVRALEVVQVRACLQTAFGRMHVEYGRQRAPPPSADLVMAALDMSEWPGTPKPVPARWQVNEVVWLAPATYPATRMIASKP